MALYVVSGRAAVSSPEGKRAHMLEEGQNIQYLSILHQINYALTDENYDSML